jgi:hypothetical protein
MTGKDFLNALITAALSAILLVVLMEVAAYYKEKKAAKPDPSAPKPVPGPGTDAPTNGSLNIPDSFGKV